MSQSTMYVPKHRKPGRVKMNWLFMKGESTWRGLITFTAGVIALCLVVFLST